MIGPPAESNSTESNSTESNSTESNSTESTAVSEAKSAIGETSQETHEEMSPHVLPVEPYGLRLSQGDRGNLRNEMLAILVGVARTAATRPRSHQTAVSAASKVLEVLQREEAAKVCVGIEALEKMSAEELEEQTQVAKTVVASKALNAMNPESSEMQS